MSRGGILLAVALTLALSPAAAAGQSAAQPDLIIVGRDGNTFTGDGIYDADGVGERRSVIVDRRTVVVLRLQNDGSRRGTFRLSGTPPFVGFSVKYQIGQRVFRAQKHEPGSEDLAFHVSLSMAPGASIPVRVVIEAARSAPLGAPQRVLLVAISTSGQYARDGIVIDATKTSTPV